MSKGDKKSSRKFRQHRAVTEGSGGVSSERDTAYLLKSETMKARPLAAKQRQDGIPFEAAAAIITEGSRNY
jgi:hypothetical protein